MEGVRVGKLYSNFSKANDLLKGNVSYFLDLVRGISAILVVMEHLSSRLLVGYGNVKDPNIIVKFVYLLNMLGNPAVIIFFVLSGLFISRSVINSLFIDQWSWKTYLINRLSRLYVVLIPALIITLILDLIASTYFGFHSYDHAQENVVSLIGNLLFLQNIFVNVYGSNAPLWSLNYEFWYYILFPLLMMLFLYKKGKVFKGLHLLVIVSIMMMIGFRMNSYFIIWLTGAVILVLPNIKLLTKKFMPIIALLLVIVTMFIHPLVMTGKLFTHHWTSNPYLLNLIIGLSFGFLIYTLMHNSVTIIKTVQYKKFAKFSKLLSSFSFTLYLIHYPIINTVYYWSAKNGFTGFQPNLLGIFMEILLVSIICTIAFFFSRITEGKTSVIRKFIFKEINILTSHYIRVVNKLKKVG